MLNVDTFDVLGVRISAIDLNRAVQLMDQMIARREKAYVCVAPVSTIVDAQQDPAYRAVVNAASLVTPDGMPVAWLGQQRFGTQVARTYGPDLMLKVCREGQGKGIRHFFYGGSRDVCDKLVQSLKTRFPDMIIAGIIAPPYMPQAQRIAQDVAEAINAAKADILWVGLGSPKQDFWMSLNREALDVPVMIGIGAAFDFHSGVKPQAPQWMQRSGLEWVFRLLSEPRRLWKRYLLGNTLFVWWLIKEKLFDRAGGRS